VGVDDVRGPADRTGQGEGRLRQHGEAPRVVFVLLVLARAVEPVAVVQFVAGQQVDRHAVEHHLADADVVVDATALDDHRRAQPLHPALLGLDVGPAVARQADAGVVAESAQRRRQGLGHVGQAAALDERGDLGGHVEDAQRSLRLGRDRLQG